MIRTNMNFHRSDIFIRFPADITIHLLSDKMSFHMILHMIFSFHHFLAFSTPVADRIISSGYFLNQVFNVVCKATCRYRERFYFSSVHRMNEMNKICFGIEKRL